MGNLEDGLSWSPSPTGLLRKSDGRKNDKNISSGSAQVTTVCSRKKGEVGEILMNVTEKRTAILFTENESKVGIHQPEQEDRARERALM